MSKSEHKSHFWAAVIGLVLWALIALVLFMAVMTLGEAAKAGDFPASSRAYEPHGAAAALLYARDDEVVLSGPAGTGKSRGILEKLHLVCLKYPLARVLIVRQTRASMTDSVLVTFEDHVLPDGSYLKQGAQRERRHSYKYRNGSEIVVGGMDKPLKIMSTEFDIIFWQEAIEGHEDAWESLTTRLRNGRLPYQQMIGDVNPSSPKHWLKKRMDRGVTKLLESRHEDNPRLYDRRSQQWSEFGKKYLAKLDALTGVRKLRLRHGIWAMAEGMIYADTYDPARNVIDRFDVPKEWPRYWSVDFGFTNPFVWQCWAVDGDGRGYLIAEIYQTKRLVEDHCKTIEGWMKRTGEDWPRALITDHDAEDRATMERHLGISTTAAVKTIRSGNEACGERLRPAGDGRARLFFLRDSLLETDADLLEAKLPASTVEEFESYVWDEKKDEPVDAFNHGMDAMRYFAMYLEHHNSMGVHV